MWYDPQKWLLWQTIICYDPQIDQNWSISAKNHVLWPTKLTKIGLFWQKVICYDPQNWPKLVYFGKKSYAMIHQIRLFGQRWPNAVLIPQSKQRWMVCVLTQMTSYLGISCPSFLCDHFIKNDRCFDPTIKTAFNLHKITFNKNFSPFWHPVPFSDDLFDPPSPPLQVQTT